jgi:hypothetical protein
MSNPIYRQSLLTLLLVPLNDIEVVSIGATETPQPAPTCTERSVAGTVAPAVVQMPSGVVLMAYSTAIE